MVALDITAPRGRWTRNRRSAVLRRVEKFCCLRGGQSQAHDFHQKAAARASKPAAPQRPPAASRRRRDPRAAPRRPRRASSAAHRTAVPRSAAAGTLRLATSRAVDNVRPEGGEEGRVEQPDKGLLGGAGGARRRALRSATLRATANARARADAPRRPQAAAGNMTSTEENVKSMIAYMQKADDPMCARAAAARAPAAA